MADILSRIMIKLRIVGPSRQNDVNDVSTAHQEVKRLWEPDLIGQSTDSISSRDLGCHLWPTSPERPAFTRGDLHALIFRRLFKPTVQAGEAK